MTPDFLILANGLDSTLLFRDRLISLIITDNDGGEADRAEIVLDDRQNLISISNKDAILQIWLGFRGALMVPMGVFAVDGISGEGPPLTRTITATAANLKGPIRAPQSREWEDKTLGDIVQKIAAEAGLKAVVGVSIAQVKWAYLAQTDESNLNFLTRITADLDATAKPAGGALVVQKRGEGKSAAGDIMPPAILPRTRLRGWQWSLDGRATYGSVSAVWRDTKTGVQTTIVRGNGAPKMQLRHLYQTKDEATRAADGTLAAAARAALTITADVAGFAPDIMAGGTALLSGLHQELNGLWHVKQAIHTLDNAGLLTRFEAKKGGGAAP